MIFPPKGICGIIFHLIFAEAVFFFTCLHVSDRLEAKKSVEILLISLFFFLKSRLIVIYHDIDGANKINFET